MEDTLRRSRIVIVTIFLAAVGALVPVMGMLWITWSLAVDDEQAALDAVAQRVLMRAQRSTGQARSAFAQLEGDDGIAPCSPAHIGRMRRIAFNTPAIEEIGYFEGGLLKCTSWGLTDTRVPLARTDFRTTDGIGVTLAVKPALQGGTTKLAFHSGSYDALLDPVRLIDVIAAPQVQMALTTRGGHLIAELNDPDAALISDIAAHRQASGQSDISYAVIRSANWTAVAISPRPEFFDTLRREQWMLLPIGVFIAGMIVAVVLWVSRQRLSFAAEIAAAIRNREFSVHYQPIIDLRSGGCVGAEALLRWQRHDGSWIGPDLFIPVAEHAGMIPALTTQVIEHIAADLGERLVAEPDLHIAINVAPELFTSEGILAQLERLTALGIRSGQIWLEATERSFLDDALGGDTITKAHAIGYRVAMDDFGTGYSSLAHLQKISFDALKIDKSFVDTIGVSSAKSAVISHIIELAKELGVDVVAEGVEQPVQADYLRERDVQFAQGWLFARALPAQDFLAYLDSHRPIQDQVVTVWPAPRR